MYEVTTAVINVRGLIIIHGTERNGTAEQSRNFANSIEMVKNLQARVLRLRLLPPDGQVGGSTYTGISGWLRGPY